MFDFYPLTPHTMSKKEIFVGSTVTTVFTPADSNHTREEYQRLLEDVKDALSSGSVGDIIKTDERVNGFMISVEYKTDVPSNFRSTLQINFPTCAITSRGTIDDIMLPYHSRQGCMARKKVASGNTTFGVFHLGAVARFAICIFVGIILYSIQHVNKPHKYIFPTL